MKRKYVYGLVALPLVIAVACLLVVPSGTRSTFLSEFVHRTKLMFGFQPEPIVGADGELGLRLERPEEYGRQPDGSGDEAATATEDVGAGDQADAKTATEGVSEEDASEEGAVTAQTPLTRE